MHIENAAADSNCSNKNYPRETEAGYNKIKCRENKLDVKYVLKRRLVVGGSNQILKVEGHKMLKKG